MSKALTEDEKAQVASHVKAAIANLQHALHYAQGCKTTTRLLVVHGQGLHMLREVIKDHA